MRELSKQLGWFAGKMAQKLRENDHKGSWAGLDNNYLEQRLYQEFIELTEAITKGNPDEIIAEAADVANFALMIADNANRTKLNELAKMGGGKATGGIVVVNMGHPLIIGEKIEYFGPMRDQLVKAIKDAGGVGNERR